MTSIQMVNPWTPELIAKDKELKKKYGKNAHIIPAPVSFVHFKGNKEDNIQIVEIKNKTPKYLKTGILLGAVLGSILALRLKAGGLLGILSGTVLGGGLAGIVCKVADHLSDKKKN